jgi:hypothetical protein
VRQPSPVGAQCSSSTVALGGRWQRRGDLQDQGIEGELRGTKNWCKMQPGRCSPVRQRSRRRWLQSRRRRRGSDGQLQTRSQGGEEVLAAREGKKGRRGKRAGCDDAHHF